MERWSGGRRRRLGGCVVVEGETVRENNKEMRERVWAHMCVYVSILISLSKVSHVSCSQNEDVLWMRNG